ncbi:diguanylate cyclase domain-containing protein [Pseudidiomarina sp.]|uniref:sensor domain-containing diguanylate cyclase n=1 Tax=Pseudidiomarina sp. TaxID=2081707 RepID=UPI003A98473A
MKQNPFNQEELMLFFEQLWKKSLNPFWVCKPIADDFEMIIANPAAQALDKRQTPGAKFSELITHSAYSPDILSGYYECLATKEPVEFEQTAKHKGKEFVFRTFLVPILDDDEKVTHIWGTSHNLTDFLDPQRELLALNQLLDAKVRERTEQLNQAMEKLEKLSITDELTQLANRRYFDKALKKEIARAKRTAGTLALIYFDIDYFKTFNDTYGHSAGDRCLKQVAKVLAAHAKRSADVVARYGGEEFVMLLPNLNKQQALEVAELVRRDIAKLELYNENAPAGQITMSAGIAVVQDNFTADDLLKLADDALYQSKADGRNRSLVAD